ncbi:Protein of unknown function (DUF3043) [Murinocardiopsis flavida]|uniref:DUF3043 family protein n=1 Tax=Murinocardiopsis flavida TaxID=645275 RepID=A0A2P8CZZ4_9ACTN|nr:DUF3043 domain-containing protein [Murinocardiopsis flavida]PSK90539.1 Protein of unknown function (DUF3043) [Murinocardiopsis flavida]
MFRRRSASASEEQAQPGSVDTEPAEAAQRKGYTPKKGAATPKRRESEQSLRRPLNAPQTRKEAYRQYRDRQKTRDKRVREGYAKGDDRYYRRQDLGPARAYARDVADSRRSISEFFLIFSLVIIVALFVLSPEYQLIVSYVIWPVMLVTMLFEGFLISRKVKKAAVVLYPEDDNLRGVGFYAAMRQLQMRKLRLPKPVVKPGDKVTPRR